MTLIGAYCSSTASKPILSTITLCRNDDDGDVDDEEYKLEGKSVMQDWRQ